MEFIDVYSKLEIGVISFIAPLTSYLLTTYIADRRKITQKLNEERKQFKKILTEDLKAAASNADADAIEFIKKSAEKNKQNEEDITRKIQLLEDLVPKQCIVNLFGLLFISMGLLLADVLVRENIFNLYTHVFSVGLLSLSFLIFIIAIYDLRRVALILIFLKEETEEIKQSNEAIEVKAAK